MSVTVRKVETKQDLKKFINFHYSLFNGHPAWVPPLRQDEMHTLKAKQNPAFNFCDAALWLAYKDNKIVGRIAGIINNRFNELWSENQARFSYIDFIDDAEVSNALIDTVENWAREHGKSSIHGPLSFTDFDTNGMLVEGYDEIGTFGSGHHFPYYKEHLEKHGYSKDIDWIEFLIEMPTSIPEKVERIAQIVEKRNNLHMLHAKKPKDLLPYAHGIFSVINQAYSHLYGFVTLTDEQIDMYTKQYFSFIRPEFVPVVLDENDNVAAFGVTMPSLSKAMQKSKGKLFPFGVFHLMRAMKQTDKMDLYLTAVRPDLQNKGVNAMLMYHINKVFVDHKVKWVETNRELEENKQIQAQWKHYPGRQHKRRRVFKKEL